MFTFCVLFVYVYIFKQVILLIHIYGLRIRRNCDLVLSLKDSTGCTGWVCLSVTFVCRRAASQFNG